MKTDYEDIDSISSIYLKNSNCLDSPIYCFYRRTHNMLKKMLCILFLCLVATTAKSAHIAGNAMGLDTPGTELTFDEISLVTNSVITNEYDSFGVTFTGLFYAPSGFIEEWTPDGDYPYLSNAIAGSPGDNWSIKFDSIQNEAAFSLSPDFGTHTLVAKLDGVDVEFVSFDGSSWGYYGFTGILFDELQMITDSKMLIDNLQFSDSVPVPEPTSILLLGTGLGALGFVTYQRKRK